MSSFNKSDTLNIQKYLMVKNIVNLTESKAKATVFICAKLCQPYVHN